MNIMEEDTLEITGDYWRLPMLMPVTEAWPRLAGVQKIVPGIC